MYFVVVAIVFIISLIEMGGHLTESPSRITFEICAWGTFGLFQAPNFNGYTLTFFVTSGVTWTLRYEWLFYFSLPLLGMLSFYKPKIKYVWVSIVIAVTILTYRKFDMLMNSLNLYPFFTGIIAAYVVRNRQLTDLLQGKLFSVLAFICFGVGTLAVFRFESLFLFLFSIAFIIIASGNSLFGLLRSKASLIFGQMSYSIYLIHPLVLFVTYTYILGLKQTTSLSSFEFWVVTLIMTPVLLLVCHCSYIYIEKPFIALGKRIFTTKKREMTQLVASMAS